MRSAAVSRSALAIALLVVLTATLATTALAVPKGFTTDVGDACKEAQATGKLIFCFFHLTG